MKAIENILDIDLSFSGVDVMDTTVYILPECVLVEVTRYPASKKIGIVVSNARRKSPDFYNKSYGMSYENSSVFTTVVTTTGLTRLQSWIDQSKY